MGYLLGSVPFGVIISRLSSKKDLRQYGSGKTGATNVLRTAGKKAAAFSVVGDVLKGFLPVFAGRYLFGDHFLVIGTFGFGADVVQVLVGLAAIADITGPFS
jgi:glycerol-3-phosphate acyltransferase PlsY